MGGKGDRKATKATSSARAAEALAAKGGAAGFGGFVGGRLVAGFGFGAAAAAAVNSATGAAPAGSGEALELSAELDGDLAQCLRHLSKRDTVTKMKALQSLKDLVPTKCHADLALFLQPWGYQFKRLLLDPAKSVRVEAVTIMAAVGAAVGKALLPHLKGLLGPWYLACFDPYPGAAAAAAQSLAEVFPGKKQADVLVFCRREVLSHITTCLASTPQSLGDARRDAPHEMEERHARITAASLTAAAALLTTLVQQQQPQQLTQEPDAVDQQAATDKGTPEAAAAAAAVQEVVEKLQELLNIPGFFKKHLGSKAIEVRRAAYGLVNCMSVAAPELLASCEAAAAPLVLGALQEKEPVNHPAMWRMLLSYINSQQPGCWAAVNMQKAFLPRLLALLRHGCYGSAAVSLPALLPLLALFPRQLLSLQPVLLLDQILESLWLGLPHCAGNQAARNATAAAYQECFNWGAKQAPVLATATGSATAAGVPAADAAAGSPELYCKQLIQQGHFGTVLLELALSQTGHDATLAADIVQGAVLQLCSVPAAKSSSSMAQETVISNTQQPGNQLPLQLSVLLVATAAVAVKHLCAAAAAAAGDGSLGQTEPIVCSRLQQLFDTLSASTAVHSQAAGAQLAASCCTALLSLLHSGQQLQPAAAKLLARLIREYSASSAASGSSLLASSQLGSKDKGAAAAAAAADSTAAAASTANSSSITAVMRLGIRSTSDTADHFLSKANADLLLSCVAGSHEPPAAWAEVVRAVQQDGPTAQGLQFLANLLQRFVDSHSSTTTSIKALRWSHPTLDALVVQLAQETAASVSSNNSSNGIGNTQGFNLQSVATSAAAARLLGCCLGGNSQKCVLLGTDAVIGVVDSMLGILQDMQAYKSHQQLLDQQQHAVQSGSACISALGQALAYSTSSSSQLWLQQPQQLVHLLLLLAQLSWGAPDELLLPDTTAKTADEPAGSGSESDSDSDNVYSDANSVATQACTSGWAMVGFRSQGVTTNVGIGSTTLQETAARVWQPELVAAAMSNLPAPQITQLLHLLQQLFVSGIQTAAITASQQPSAQLAAAMQAGLQWGNRAAQVLAGLSAKQQLQQQLINKLLTALPDWLCWSDSSSSSGTNTGPCDMLGHSMLIMVTSVLVLRLGCSVMLPWQSSGTDKAAAAVFDANRQWLLLELLCSSAYFAQEEEQQQQLLHSGGERNTQLQHCVSAAAAAAQKHLCSIACSDDSSTTAAAGDVLSSMFSMLLYAAQSAEPSSVQVWSAALSSLLQHASISVAAHSDSKERLLPILQQFCSNTVAAAVAQQDTPHAGSLLSVLEVLASMFRFRSEADVTAARLDNLSLDVIARARQLQSLEASSTAADSSDSAREQALLLQLLQLCGACFPVQFSHRQHQQQQAGHAANRLHAGSSTSAERQALMQLLQQVCSSSSSSNSSMPKVLCQLQLCCVGYCWSEMSAPDWHVVLHDLQQQLSSARRDTDRTASGLAGAACTAAQQFLAAMASRWPDTMTPVLAIQLLSRLADKSLLQGQAAIVDMLTGLVQQAVQGLPSPTLRLSLQLLSAVIQLQQQVQEAGRAPQLGLALSAAWRELLALCLSLGAAVAVAAGCGEGPLGVVISCLSTEGATWQLLADCLDNLSELNLLDKAVTAANDRLEMLGVDSVSSCLALLQAPTTSMQQQQPTVQRESFGPLQQLAWRLLLRPNSLAHITHAASTAAKGDGAAEMPEFGVNGDAATYLVHVGLRPELAAAVTTPDTWETFLLHWALLLAHLAKLRVYSPQAQRVLTLALRDVPELVPQLLELVVGLMGLRGSSKGSNAAMAFGASDSSGDTGAAGSWGTGSSAAAVGLGKASTLAGLAQLSGKLQAMGSSSNSAATIAATATDSWDLTTALANIGLPTAAPKWQLLAAAVYRAVLHLLPASARLWFSDLRDRSLTSAVEVYTTKYESPALLAAEFAVIKRDSAGSSGEVGANYNFKVKASQAAREVTAVLEIEDGATLVLQVKLPAAAPLKAAEVECKNKVGIRDARLRKWLLSIAVFLRNQNQGVLDAISMWKANLEQEFAGVQPCLICYSVISAANGQLPRLVCNQCSVTFHPACLYKWFRSSGKSTCPHCQAPW